jgi:hypothetical protein
MTASHEGARRWQESRDHAIGRRPRSSDSYWMKTIIAVLAHAAAAARTATAPAHSNPYAPDRLRITRGRAATVGSISLMAVTRPSR